MYRPIIFLNSTSHQTDSPPIWSYGKKPKEALNNHRAFCLYEGGVYASDALIASKE